MPAPTQPAPTQVGHAVVTAAASARVAAALDGPVRTAEVISAGTHALYVRDPHAGDPHVRTPHTGDPYVRHGSPARTAHLAVLGRDAVQVPCGLRTRLAALPRVATVTLGAGRCVVGDHTVAVRRLVDVRVPRLGVLDAGAWPAGTDDRLEAARSELPGAALDILRRGDPAAVRALVGRGSGLTPVGDDVLAGWLVTCHATGTDAAPVADAVRVLAAERTTVVSAALLGHAADGESIPQLRTALLSLRTGVGVAPALDDLLAVGHTSGSGLALGVGLALHHPSVRRLHR